MPDDHTPPQRERAAALWAEQVGPAYTRQSVADLLGITPQTVARRKGLLALEQSSGGVVYPVFQFDGCELLAGIDEVVRVMTPVVETAWTIAAMLTAPQRDLDGRTPVQALREGDMEDVLLLARRAANALSA